MGGVASEAAVGGASRPGLKRPAYAFAVVGTDQAVAVFVSLHIGDSFVCFVHDINHAAVIGRSQCHQLFAVGPKCRNASVWGSIKSPYDNAI